MRRAPRPVTWSEVRAEVQDIQLRLLQLEKIPHMTKPIRDGLRREAIALNVLMRRMNGRH